MAAQARRGGGAHDPQRPGAAQALTLSEALREEALRCGVSILFPSALVTGRRAPTIGRGGDVAARLGRLLAGSGLRARRLSSRSFIVEALSAPPPSPAVTPADIVVTAMRHPTILGNTPVSMVVVGGDELERAHVTALRQLAGLAPSLTVTESANSLARLSVRGAYAAGEPTVGLYYGNVPIAGPSGTTSDPSAMTPDLALVDVERVELLRGPQGTLYGAGSLAGTLRILFNPADPTRRAASVEVSANSVADGAPGSSVTLMVNRPTDDGHAALRAVLWREVRGGTIDNRVLHITDVDRSIRSGGRLALQWRPAKDWRLDLIGTYQAGRTIDNGAQTSGSGIGQTAARVRAPFRDDFLLLAADLHGEIWRGLSFDATLSHTSWRTHRIIDFTATTLSHENDAVACGHYFSVEGSGCSASRMADFNAYVQSQSPSVLDQPFSVTTDNVEARLSGSGAMTWTAGVFASRRRDQGNTWTRPVDAATGMIDRARPATAARTFGGNLDQFAAFADGEWRTSGWLTLSAGLRTFDYRRHAQGFIETPSPITGPFDPSGFDQSYRAGGSVGRLRGEVRWAAGMLSYLQISGGFRPGGINVVPGLPSGLASYRDDRLTSIEWGTRGTFLHDHVQVELSAYRQSWSRMQYAVQTLDSAYGFIGNIGSARIDGLELSMRWRILPGLKARIEATGTDARLTSDQTSMTATSPGRAGDRLPNVAPIAAAASLSYDRELGSTCSLSATAILHYTGKSYAAFPGTGGDPRTAVGNATSADIDLGIKRRSAVLSVYVQNIGDARPIQWTGKLPGQTYVSRMRPRTIGISVRHGL
ncbi:TonB-dependent receptor [Sphingomonas sp.]|uniref:TonB-dependent receptor n=1 Tax=Sphingomonas sp. TaxID=28214 RepID=UPI0031D4C9F3